MATSLVVAIDKEAISVGSERVALVSDASASPDMLIEPLANRLNAARDQMDNIARLKGDGQTASRLVTIQGDEDIEFRVLEKVMYTLDKTGFPDVALAVIKKAQG